MTLILFGVIIGGICSATIFHIMRHMLNIGYLNIDRSDPYDNPYLFLELTKNIQTFQKSKYIVLKVKQHNYLDTRK